MKKARIVFTAEFQRFITKNGIKDPVVESVWLELKKYHTGRGIFIDEADAGYWVLRYPAWLSIGL